MSDDKKEEKNIPKESSFLIATLANDPWPLFNVYYPTFKSAVALAGLNETDMVTKSEMKKHIDNYMNHPVKG